MCYFIKYSVCFFFFFAYPLILTHHVNEIHFLVGKNKQFIIFDYEVNSVSTVSQFILKLEEER